MTSKIPVVALNNEDTCDWCGRVIHKSQQHIWPVGSDDYAIVCSECVLENACCDNLKRHSVSDSELAEE